MASQFKQYVYTCTGLKTAFKSTFGNGKPNVCVICEIDPEISHA